MNNEPDILDIEVAGLAGQTATSKTQLPAIISRDLAATDYPTNLDVTTRRGKSLVLAAMSPATLDFDKNGQVKILATNWIAFPDSGVDPETGEISEFTRLVFFDANGNTYRTSAAHGLKRMRAILQLFDESDWRSGLPITVTERKGKRSKGVYHDIRIDDEQAAGG